MEHGIVSKLTPEQEELEKKKVELALLEKDLADRELDLATFQGELNAFEREYFRVVGIRYTELDRLEAQINEYMALLESSCDFKPSAELKKLYREVAKCIHPDLATDEDERQLRHQLMSEANQAYEDGDEERLKEILHKWQSSPESVKGEGISTDWIRIVRQIYQSKERLNLIQEEIEVLEETELYQLKIQVIKARESGQDLFSEMAAQLDEEIEAANEKLEELKVKLGL
ncbi:MAG: molecular chaperone DnaJ [Xenococcaceae cyanobacterium]